MARRSIGFTFPLRRALVVAATLAAVTSAPARAEDEQPTWDANWLPGSVALRGVTHVRENTWCIGGSKVYNPTDKDVELLLAISFMDSPHVQFTRRVWVPPRAKRSIQVPLRSPRFKAVRSIEVKVDLLDGESRLGGDRGLFRVDRVEPAMAITADVGDDFSQQAGTAIRLAGGLPRAKPSLREADMPPIFIGYGGLDSLVICRDEIDPDPAQLLALRQWLLSGGKLWIMAEQVNPRFFEMLLGDEWTGQVVDYVQMNRMRITGGSRGDAVSEFEKPVRMVRMFAPGWHQVHQVRGWPASLHKRVGLGWVLVTTVGPRAWYQLVPGREPAPGDTKPRREFEESAHAPLRELAGWFNQKLPKSPLPDESMAKLARSQIGYQTLSRTPVAIVFVLFVVALVVSTVTLVRAGTLERSGWIGVLLAAGVSVSLLILMKTMQTPVPLTISEANVIRVMPRAGYGVVDGALAVFSPEGGKGPLRGVKGGAIFPDLRTQRTELVRVQTDDLGRWVWDDVVLPTRAFLNAATRHIVRLKQPVSVQMSFDDQGALLTVAGGELAPLEDAVIAAANGYYVPPVKPGPNGVIRITEKQRLTPGQYIGGKTMGSAQLRRQQLYRDLFEPRISAPVGETIRDRLPLLAAWCQSLDLGYGLPQEHATKKTSLAILPIDLMNVPAGTQVTVPAGFIGYELATGPSGEGNKTVFDPKRRQWIAVNSGTVVVLRFAIPGQVLPLDITGGSFTVDIDAPGRTVRPFHFVGGRRVLMAAAGGPPRLRANLDEQTDAISHDDDGNLYLALEIGDASGQAQWQIKDVQLQLSGTVLPAGD